MTRALTSPPRVATALSMLAALAGAADVSAQTLTRYCTPGAVQACVGLSLTTTPRVGGGTNVTVQVANLEGTTLAGVTSVTWSQLHGVDLIGPAAFAGGAPGPLTVATTGAAKAVGDVPDRWNVNVVSEVDQYLGYALSTDIEQAGADLIGCAAAPTQNYPYYQTCGTSGDGGALVFQFATVGTWTAGQLGVTFAVRTSAGDLACEIPGTLWDAADVPNCVTPGVTSPAAQAQTISFSTTAPAEAFVGATYAVAANATSGLAVALAAGPAATCTLAAGVVTFATEGLCTVTADQAGNASWIAAPQLTQVITVARRAQTLSWTAAPPATAMVGATATVAAQGTSGLTVGYSSLTPLTCTVSGTTVSFTGAGPCTVAADQTGNGTWLAATQLTASTTVAAPPPPPPTWTFGGFVAPVEAPPALNTVRAGAGVPLKFSLGGDRGLQIFAPGAPASTAVACGTGTPTGTDVPTVTAGQSSLSYDAPTALYTYVWRTERAWAGTCRQLTLRFADGSTQTAIFSLR